MFGTDSIGVKQLVKIALLALNSSYIHTNLAVRSIRDSLTSAGYGADIFEYNIKDRRGAILSALYREAADIYGFSSYIWNISQMLSIADDLKKLRPESTIVFGGPEVSYNAEELLAKHSFIDHIITGEGEYAFIRLAESAGKSKLPPVIDGGMCGSFESSGIHYDADGHRPAGRILYYESSRGCPYKCAYCLSSLTQRIRAKPAEKTLRDLLKFESLPYEVNIVKFVDRTFNADRERALAIWRHLAESDNGTTGFQFEITAELLDEEQLQYLSSVRPGLFQFEIGVQSSFPPALAAVRRPCRLDSLSHAVRRLGEAGNIHRHLDLIAGLPLEGFSDFRRSFEFVFSLRPEQLQLGFLKVLAGAPIAAEAKRYGILFAPDPPYEVLATGALSHGELLRIKRVEAAVELYYNSGRFDAMLQFALPLFPTAFSLFEALGDQLADGERHDSGWYHTAFLRAVSQRLGFDCSALLAPRCRFDLAAVSKPNTVPGWARVPYPKERIAALCPNDRPSADHFLGVFPGGLCGRPEPEVLVRFDYARRDLRGRAAAHVLGPFAP